MGGEVGDEDETGAGREARTHQVLMECIGR